MTADEQFTLPRWAPVAAAVFAVAIAGLAPFTHREGPLNPAEIILTMLAVTPWIVELFGKPVPRPLFAVMVLSPLAVLNVAGEQLGLVMHHDAQLSLMLVVLAAGQLAATSTPAGAWLYGLGALLVPLGRFGFERAFEEWVFWAAGILLAAGAGVMLRRQQALLVQLHAAHEALASEAALQERRRIAGEVHDVIAHSLSVTMLHLTAARLAVRRNPVEAEEALAEAEKLGRQALTDVRRTVGLLHNDAGGSTAAALPAAADLPALVEGYASAGLDVQFHCGADLTVLTPAGGLALYRAVQEGLANAVKHAPGAAVTVALSQEADRVVIEIHNEIFPDAPTGGGSGLGLRGMRERVEAVGGSVAAGPRGKGWFTTCAIPVETTL